MNDTQKRSVAHFWRACVTNHTPFNSFALLNSSHHGAIQTAANLPTCSLNVSLLSTDKRNKCLKSNIIKKEKRNYVLTLTLQPGLASHRRHNVLSFTGSRQISLSLQPLCFISVEIDIATKKKKKIKIRKKNNICLNEVISSDFLICTPANFFLHMTCLKNHIKIWEDEEMVFQSSIRDKSQPDSISSAIKKQTFETNKLIKQLSKYDGLKL